ncbi:HAD family hydrolase [Paenibacillus sp. GCM10023248]|uniref:HAD family hydrolase n=1 Tax=Bacillales TaxID=1385 RepID=UPI0023798BAF|nr:MULTISPECIES: HAD family hydrolase [Bacillales]MDD9268484.1 HAD family hydrolase [Paenibacillus sp. MAHUQ-63]MDR6879376.1 phosphoglycolate phosphatase/pyrophosphatase PpaX [Bacillus sp. 3255]
MTTELILFDFDGTLADTLPLSFAAFKRVFKKHDGQDVTNDKLISMFGPTEDEIIAKNFQNKEVVQNAIDEYYDLYGQGHSEINDLHSIIVLLDLLKENNKQIAVITGKSRKAFDISSEALKISKYFDYVVTGDDVERAKPDPEGVYKAIQFFGSQAEKVVFLGDSHADIMAGKSAGVRTYAVQWLSTYQTTAFDIQPDAIFTNTADFIALLKNEGSLR